MSLDTANTRLELDDGEQLSYDRLLLATGAEPRRLSMGVRMLMGTGVEALEGDGAVECVRTSDGRVIDCDFVVVGVGMQPCTALAAEAGLAISNGILVDARLRANAPGVFAAGDVANAQHPLYGETIRVEHWANALNQAPAGARNMLGESPAWPVAVTGSSSEAIPLRGSSSPPGCSRTA